MYTLPCRTFYWIATKEDFFPSWLAHWEDRGDFQVRPWGPWLLFFLLTCIVLVTFGTYIYCHFLHVFWQVLRECSTWIAVIPNVCQFCKPFASSRSCDILEKCSVVIRWCSARNLSRANPHFSQSTLSFKSMYFHKVYNLKNVLHSYKIKTFMKNKIWHINLCIFWASRAYRTKFDVANVISRPELIASPHGPRCWIIMHTCMS